MPEPTLGDIATTLGNIVTRLDRIEESQKGTDELVTALYNELVGTTPNLRTRVETVESNVAEIIKRTPGAGELHQPVYNP